MKKKRCLRDDELKTIRNEEDMLKGNVNRMCTSDNSEELIDMYGHALLRLRRIYNICWDKFLSQNESED